MYSTDRLMTLFVLFTLLSSTQAFKEWHEMNWKKNPEETWPFTDHHFENRVAMLLLNIPNYFNNNKEWTFIATGVLLDNSRILTSYNPFRELIRNPNITDNILALVSVGAIDRRARIKITNIVCGRQIAYVPEKMHEMWRGKEFLPIHDLMIVRMAEEVGIALASYKIHPIVSQKYHKKENWNWGGEIRFLSSVISFPARIADVIDPEVQIFTLGYLTIEQMQDYDTIHEISYDTDDAALVDCDEWLPRLWGFFICVRNIGNFPGIGSGATLFSNNKLFGIGNFAMFKNNIGILVFTDVRPYEELIDKTCGDEEFD